MKTLEERRVLWESAAATYQLQYKDNRDDQNLQVDDHKIHGELHGLQLLICIKHHAFSEGNAIATGRLDFARPMGIGLMVTKRKIWHMFRRSLKVGDEDFDKDLFVQAKDEVGALRLLDSNVRAKLCDLVMLVPRLVMDDRRVSWEMSGTVSQKTSWASDLNVTYSAVHNAREGDDLDEILELLFGLAKALHNIRQGEVFAADHSV